MNAAIETIDAPSRSTLTDATHEDPIQEFGDAADEAASLSRTLHTLVGLAEDETDYKTVKALLEAIGCCLLRLDCTVESMSSAFYSARA